MKGEDDVNTAKKDEEADGSGEFLIFFVFRILIARLFL